MASALKKAEKLEVEIEDDDEFNKQITSYNTKFIQNIIKNSIFFNSNKKESLYFPQNIKTDESFYFPQKYITFLIITKAMYFFSE